MTFVGMKIEDIVRKVQAAKKSDGGKTQDLVRRFVGTGYAMIEGASRDMLDELRAEVRRARCNLPIMDAQ